MRAAREEKGRTMKKKDVLPVRAFLLHVTHYDPVWVKRKRREKPMDVALALELVDAMAETGLNTLVVDCADGVKYKTHPELARHYTIAMGAFRRIVSRARKHGIDVVPKLNFARSCIHHHNKWFMPHTKMFDTEQYWRTAFELIDELIGECGPKRYFHIGMDEDHNRSYSQYVEAIGRLREGLKKRGLRAVMWKDAQTWADAQIHREKSDFAEDRIPRDVVQVPWCYRETRPEVVKRLCGKGFEVWGAPGGEPEQVRNWRRDMLRCDGKGLLLTRWIPCRPGNRKQLLGLIRACGPACAGS